MSKAHGELTTDGDEAVVVDVEEERSRGGRLLKRGCCLRSWSGTGGWIFPPQGSSSQDPREWNEISWPMENNAAQQPKPSSPLTVACSVVQEFTVHS